MADNRRATAASGLAGGGESRKERLKEMGCEVWMEPGSLTDQMGGYEIVTTGKGSFGWDETENRFVGTFPNSNGYAASLITSIPIASTFVNGGYTYLYKNVRKYGSGNVYPYPVTTNTVANDGRFGVPILWNGTANLNSWPATPFDMAGIVPITEKRVYFPNDNGQWYEVSPSEVMQPQHWTQPNISLYFFQFTNSNLRNVSVAFEEFMLFDRCLTKAEVHELIQGIPEE